MKDFTIGFIVGTLFDGRPFVVYSRIDSLQITYSQINVIPY